jgi:hypothetical protein
LGSWWLSKVGWDEKLRDSEDREKESKKELEKEQPSSSAITSQPLFQMEVKVSIKIYKGETDIVKLNHRLQ